MLDKTLQEYDYIPEGHKLSVLQIWENIRHLFVKERVKPSELYENYRAMLEPYYTQALEAIEANMSAGIIFVRIEAVINRHWYVQAREQKRRLLQQKSARLALKKEKAVEEMCQHLESIADSLRKLSSNETLTALEAILKAKT